jgi:hypothetical protein
VIVRGEAGVGEPPVGVADEDDDAGGDGVVDDAGGDDVLGVGGAVVCDGGCVVVAVAGEVLGLATGVPPERVRTTTTPTSATRTATTTAGAHDRHGRGGGRP